ncbi:MAG: DUF1178 family protein [Alphaproteobacteria bacterium]|nr:DUF1178 family protein [Alphaproteobacteria bacterium]
MILFNLRCASGHEFEGWFRNGDTFERQAKAKSVACPVCGVAEVEKALMAPRIGKGTREPAVDPKVPAKIDPEQAKVAEMLKVLREARRLVEENLDYVGPNFAEEARKIHYGETEKHGIYGESTQEEAEALREEGIEFGRIPWVPRADQ